MPLGALALGKAVEGHDLRARRPAAKPWSRAKAPGGVHRVDATHKHPNVMKWLADRPRWTFHFTPASASRFNAVEGFFSTITRRKIRRGMFKSVAELEDPNMRYVTAHNKTYKPFVRTASASAIDETRANPRIF